MNDIKVQYLYDKMDQLFHATLLVCKHPQVFYNLLVSKTVVHLVVVALTPQSLEALSAQIRTISVLATSSYSMKQSFAKSMIKLGLF